MHDIGTVLLFYRKAVSDIMCTVETMPKQPPDTTDGCFAVKAVVVIFLKNPHRAGQPAGGSKLFQYHDIHFIAVLLLAFIIDLFSIISTKQELDYCADEMVKQIQLSGGINSETDAMFDFLCSRIEGAEDITYSVDATYQSPTPPGMRYGIQLGTPFYITIEGRAKLGASGTFVLSALT